VLDPKKRNMKAYRIMPAMSSCTKALLLGLLGANGIAMAQSTTTTSTAPTTSPTSVAFSGTGTMEVLVFPSNLEGCLLSNGLWSIAGTCGVFTATNSGSSFTLKTSSGNCQVSGGLFTCQNGVTPTVFTEITGFLAFNGNDLFSADVIPSGVEEGVISAGIAPNNVITLNVIWESA